MHNLHHVTQQYVFNAAARDYILAANIHQCTWLRRFSAASSRSTSPNKQTRPTNN